MKMPQRQSLSHGRGSLESNAISNTSIMGSPHGAAMPYNNQLRDSIVSLGGSSDLERMVLRKVDRNSKVEIAVDMDVAIEETGQGRFQICLWLICGLIYSCCSLSTTTLSFVLPAATCDFHLSASDKGTLNIMPVAGMMIGSYVWGSFADSKGRKFVLVCSLLIDGLAGTLSSFCQDKYSFLVIRIFNGFGIIGSVSVVFAYLGEFLTDKIRDKALSSLEFCWTLGIIVEPIIGYLIIPQKWVFGEKGIFIYNSWRLYVFLCGIPSLIMGIIMLKMPESPRFLLLQGKLYKSRKVLELMFRINTRRHVDEFPVKVLLPSAQSEFYFFKSLHNMSTWCLIKRTFVGIIKLHNYLFKNCLKNILLTSYIDFGLNCSYNTLVNWVPELLNNMNHWEQTYGSGFTICDVEEGLKKLTDHAVYNFTTDASESLDNYSLAHSTLLPDVHAGGQPRKGLGECEDIDIEVYIETFMVCLCCLPTTFAVFYSIVFVSKKILLGGTLFFAGVVTLLVSIANSEEYLLYLMCMFEAFTTVIEAILFCIVVEIFPDQVRGIALCLTVTIGRFGAVVGNFIFGLTVTTHCLFPIYMFCFLLISGSISVIFFPRLKIGH